MPNWFPVDVIDVFLHDWALEVVWMLLAGWAAGGISLVLTGLRKGK